MVMVPMKTPSTVRLLRTTRRLRLERALRTRSPKRRPGRRRLERRAAAPAAWRRQGQRLVAPLDALNAAVAQANDAVGQGGGIGIVGDHEHGDAALLVEPAQEGKNLRAGLGVEVAGGLVGQDDRGVVDQGAGNGHPLLLAARQLVGVVPQALPQPELFEDGLRPLLPLGAPDAGEHERQGNVLDRRQARQQVEALEDEADAPAPVQRALGVARRAKLDAVDPDLAAARPVQPADQVHQGGLARAGDAGEGDKLAAPAL